MVFQPLSRTVLFFFAMLLLVGTEVLVVQSAGFVRNPAVLSLAVLADLVVVSSALFYWLLARPNNWSLVRTGLLALLMLRIGVFILPAHALPATLPGPFLLLFAEVGALVIAGLRFRLLRATYLRLRASSTADTALFGAFEAVFGNRAAAVILGEWHIIRYVAVGWWLKEDVPSGGTTLTTHQDSGQIALTTALGVVGLVETVGLHLLLSRWNQDVAFWLTLASLYGLLFIVADIIATIKRPSYQTTDTLHLRLGIRWKVVIPRDQIVQIEGIHEKPANRKHVLNAALLTAPNLLISLRKPVTVQGPYGIQRDVTQISLWIDGGTRALA